ncbi:hypothetical protein [Microtetraspora sp. NBRC 13810]|uniref:hypothetical protein n=1 Tax=Microtetraspora sp. NBRC 13810 TaxID=3030990 RepID=UPI002554B0A3|nr:hypothetical protein [Microtetraspora sp. NBRC 13810]
MKRFIAVLAATLVAPALATVTTVSPAAAAAPANPVDALKKQFNNGTGLRVTEISKATSSGKTLITERLAGLYAFGANGVTASDLTVRPSYDKSVRTGLAEEFEDDESDVDLLKLVTSPTRIIWQNKTAYVSNPALTPVLADGKTWGTARSASHAAPLRTAYQQVNVLEPNTLKALLADVDRKSAGGVVDGARTTLYSGVTTFGELNKVSPTFRLLHGKLSKSAAKTVLKWQLWVDGKGLPRRVVSSTTEKLSRTATWREVSDTRYSGWGTRPSVKAPAAAQVDTETDIEDAFREVSTTG